MKFRPVLHQTVSFKRVLGFCSFVFRFKDMSPNAIPVQEKKNAEL